MKMKVAVLGLGYVGLPLAVAIAKSNKYNLVGFDLNEKKISDINNKICPIDDKICAEELLNIDLPIDNNISIISNSDIYIVCVPTPVLDDYSPDLTPLISATNTVIASIIADKLNNINSKHRYIIIESTINPGVCDEVLIPMVESKTNLIAGKDFDIAHCPERINPGDEKWSVYNIPRNIGSTSPTATKYLADFYRNVIDADINELPDLKTTEATKIIENTFRDINIAFVNELAKSFDVLGIDLLTVLKGASNKPFAFMPHFPSCGVGGHCIPVDPYYLIERAKQSGFDHKFLKLAREINNSMPAYTVNLLANGLNENALAIKGTKIGLLGMSYKANVGDIRESPSIELKKILIEKGANLEIFDPYFLDLSTKDNLENLLDSVDAILIATDHKEFKNIDSELLIKHNIKVVIDGKNCLNKEEILSSGVYYKGIGR